MLDTVPEKTIEVEPKGAVYNRAGVLVLDGVISARVNETGI